MSDNETCHPFFFLFFFLSLFKVTYSSVILKILVCVQFNKSNNCNMFQSSHQFIIPVTMHSFMFLSFRIRS